MDGTKSIGALLETVDGTVTANDKLTDDEERGKSHRFAIETPLRSLSFKQMVRRHVIHSVYVYDNALSKSDEFPRPTHPATVGPTPSE